MQDEGNKWKSVMKTGDDRDSRTKPWEMPQEVGTVLGADLPALRTEMQPVRRLPSKPSGWSEFLYV